MARRKKEGHSLDAVADALPRIVFGLWFRRRTERQVEAMKTLVNVLLQGKGEEALNSCVVTADRGYSKESFLDLMVSFGLSTAFVLSDHIIRAHPLVSHPLSILMETMKRWTRSSIIPMKYISVMRKDGRWTFSPTTYQRGSKPDARAPQSLRVQRLSTTAP